MKWNYNTSMLATMVELTWTERNLLGKLIAWPLWFIGLFLVIIGDGIDIIYPLITKKDKE